MATFYTRPASYQGNDVQGRNIQYNIQMKKSRKQYFLLAFLPAVLIAIGYILIKISSKGTTVQEVEMNDKLLRPVHSTPVLTTSFISEDPATKEFLPPTKKNPIKVSKDELVDTGETHGKKDDEGSIEKFITYVLRLWKKSSETHKQCSQEEVLSAFTSQLWENKVEIAQLFSQAQWTFITLALELTVVFIMTFSKATWTFITLTLELMLVSIMAFLKATWIFLKRMSESKLILHPAMDFTFINDGVLPCHKVDYELDRVHK
ncbi:hypothetical protein BGZ49_000923 [Haplosporangium sp. Z 27]|nr:hypothetical protein BGZ49_000923 [Haplosporangium sp. Z 27]